MPLIERLREPIIADAFARGSILDGRLCERLIRDLHEAADTIERLLRERNDLASFLAGIGRQAEAMSKSYTEQNKG